MMNKSKIGERNAEIELLRFIFATIIVLRHSRSIWSQDSAPYPFFLEGAFAVDFFFLLSGYLLMASIDKKDMKSLNSSTLALDTIRFLIRKVSCFYTELIIANIIGLVILIITTTKPLGDFIKNWILSFLSDYLLLHMWICSPTNNNPLWYLSTMLLCMTILYPLLRKWPAFMSSIICPVISLVLIGYLWYTFQSFLSPDVWIGITYKGNVRGFAEICMGVFLFQVVKALKNKDLTYFGVLLASFLKWGSLLLTFYWLIFASSPTLQLFILGLYILGLILVFSEKCLDYRIYQNAKSIMFLGRLSTSLYLVHYYVVYIFKYLIKEQFAWVQGMGWGGIVVLFYFISLALAIVVNTISELIKRSGSCETLRKCFIKE